MTFGEIASLLKADHDMRSEAFREREILTAAGAYHGAVLSRCDHRSFPRDLKSAFPSLFGRTASGQIPAENWQEGQEAFNRIALQHNRDMKAR